MLRKTLTLEPPYVLHVRQSVGEGPLCGLKLTTKTYMQILKNAKGELMKCDYSNLCLRLSIQFSVSSKYQRDTADLLRALERSYTPYHHVRILP